jgi:hypothetical protein
MMQIEHKELIMLLFSSFRKPSRCWPVHTLALFVGLSPLGFANAAPSNSCQPDIEYSVVNQWQSGYQAEIAITNMTTSDLSGWSLNWAIPAQESFVSGWNAHYDFQSPNITATSNFDWNKVIASHGGSVTFGFQIDSLQAPTIPVDFIFNSDGCSEPLPPVTPPEQKSFVRASGTQIIDPEGNNLIFRGMGIGGWMVMEPYMFGFNEDADEGQHKILNDISSVVGSEKTQIFHQAWLDNFFTEQDVIELKNSGFNTIRLPMHYQLFTLPIEQEPIEGQDTWLTQGFDMVDQLLAWCRQHNIYLILDLHAAPGGQGYNGNISDYDPSKPSLWESAENQRKMVALWGKIAERYANETWIAAYDPMNEPNWGFENKPDNKHGCTEESNQPLRDMYARLIPEIRKYDTNHLIAVEGNCWGNNHSNLWPLPVPDDNVAISFHKYWNENNLESIQQYMQMRDQYQIPLWMSESGENTVAWYRDAVELLEENNIGWSWWTWKKMEHPSGVFSISKPDGFQELLDYWQSGGQQPDPVSAHETLMMLTENLKIHNAHRNQDTIDALTKAQIKCDSQPAYPLNTSVAATEYCEMSGVKSDEGYVGYFAQGDWVAYPFFAPSSGNYTLELSVATELDNGHLRIELLGGQTALSEYKLSSTNGWFNWRTIRIHIQLEAGYQHLAIVSQSDDVNLHSINLLQQ